MISFIAFCNRIIFYVIISLNYSNLFLHLLLIQVIPSLIIIRYVLIYSLFLFSKL